MPEIQECAVPASNVQNRGPGFEIRILSGKDQLLFRNRIHYIHISLGQHADFILVHDTIMVVLH